MAKPAHVFVTVNESQHPRRLKITTNPRSLPPRLPLPTIPTTSFVSLRFPFLTEDWSASSSPSNCTPEELKITTRHLRCSWATYHPQSTSSEAEGGRGPPADNTKLGMHPLHPLRALHAEKTKSTPPQVITSSGWSFHEERQAKALGSTDHQKDQAQVKVLGRAPPRQIKRLRPCG